MNYQTGEKKYSIELKCRWPNSKIEGIKDLAIMIQNYFSADLDFGSK